MGLKMSPAIFRSAELIVCVNKNEGPAIQPKYGIARLPFALRMMNQYRSAAATA
jgi:hypothetical protein